MNRRTVTIVLVGIIGSAAVISLLSRLLPAPANAEVAAYYSRNATSITLIDVIISVGSAALYLLALRNFKPELKAAYRLLALGALTYGLTNLVYPFIEYYGLWEVLPLAIASFLSFLFGSVFMYWGLRLFYKRLGLRSRLTALPTLIIATVVLWIAHAFVGHVPDLWPTEKIYDAMQLIVLIPVLFYAAGAIMAFRLRHKTGQDYKKPFGWLAAGLAAQLVSAITIEVMEIIGYENWYFSSRALWVVIILSDVCVLLAGYYFNILGQPVKSRSWLSKLLRSGQDQEQEQEVASSFAIVTYVANMASDPTKIDTYLDELRILSSRLNPGEALSVQDNKLILNVYLNIEAYLINKDELRSFDKNQLRQNVTQHFALDGPTKDSTFWPMLRA